MDVDEALKLKRQVNLEQQQALIDYLKDHQELAKGVTSGHRGKLHTLKQWNVCAKELNEYKDGAIKDGKAWSKYWCDWKYRVRRRALELKAAKNNNRSPPDGVIPLSSMEEAILGIIGEGAIDNIIIKSDPLDEGTDEDLGESHEDNLYEDGDSVKVRSRKRKQREFTDEEVCDRPSESSKSKTETKHEESDDDNAAEYLHLEREQLENSRKLCDSVQTLATEMTRLTDIMAQIRDVLVNNRIDIN